MDRLCDEVLQLIFYELSDPGPLTLVCRRFHRFSQDPYVRARYFLIHYGATEAMFYALGHGKVLTERVLDILLSSGAHMSRYLAQVAIHHYFHTQSHFIKTAWVRTLPLRAFLHFLRRAEESYGDIPVGKGEDDSSLFATFLKESRFPAQMKTVTWETIRELLETYHFIPFCARDPIMAQFPLALAVEPKLLPYATANGFSMDHKYRDFVLRRMFEKRSTNETSAEDIASSVRELLRLDATMFVSRTVAAEVCMEAKQNETGYAALKLLEKSGHLKFTLSSLIEELLKTFLLTGSLANLSIGETLVHLFSDSPSRDAGARLVVLLVIFIAADHHRTSTSTVVAKLDALRLTPLTFNDVVDILVNPFIERYGTVMDVAQRELISNVTGEKGLLHTEVEMLAQNVAIRCLEIGCKGKLLRRLVDGFPFVSTVIESSVRLHYQIPVAGIPSWEEDPGCYPQTKLARDFLLFGLGEVYPPGYSQTSPTQPTSSTSSDANLDPSSFGEITQESLSTMIRQDEATPSRSRRRHLYSYSLSDTSSKLRYPPDSQQVGKWVKAQYGPKSAVTAIFMTHAVVNNNCDMLHHYLMNQEAVENGEFSAVPVTMKHFQILARLGRAPNFYLYHRIEHGSAFYEDENDYVQKPVSDSKDFSRPHPLARSCSLKRKRPRRNAATAVSSYAESSCEDDDPMDQSTLLHRKNEKKETNLQLWIRHLSDLLRAENRKHFARKKRLEMTGPPKQQIRHVKNDFVKSMTTNLRLLRKVEAERASVYMMEELSEGDCEDTDDSEYISRVSKRPRMTIS